MADNVETLKPVTREDVLKSLSSAAEFRAYLEQGKDSKTPLSHDEKLGRIGQALQLLRAEKELKEPERKIAIETARTMLNELNDKVVEDARKGADEKLETLNKKIIAMNDDVTAFEKGKKEGVKKEKYVLDKTVKLETITELLKDPDGEKLKAYLLRGDNPSKKLSFDAQRLRIGQALIFLREGKDIDKLPKEDRQRGVEIAKSALEEVKAALTKEIEEAKTPDDKLRLQGVLGRVESFQKGALTVEGELRPKPKEREVQAPKEQEKDALDKAADTSKKVLIGAGAAFVGVPLVMRLTPGLSWIKKKWDGFWGSVRSKLNTIGTASGIGPLGSYFKGAKNTIKAGIVAIPGVILLIKFFRDLLDKGANEAAKTGQFDNYLEQRVNVASAVLFPVSAVTADGVGELGGGKGTTDAGGGAIPAKDIPKEEKVVEAPKPVLVKPVQLDSVTALYKTETLKQAVPLASGITGIEKTEATELVDMLKNSANTGALVQNGNDVVTVGQEQAQQAQRNLFEGGKDQAVPFKTIQSLATGRALALRIRVQQGSAEDKQLALGLDNHVKLLRILEQQVQVGEACAKAYTDEKADVKSKIAQAFVDVQKINGKNTKLYEIHHKHLLELQDREKMIEEQEKIVLKALKESSDALAQISLIEQERFLNAVLQEHDAAAGLQCLLNGAGDKAQTVTLDEALALKPAIVMSNESKPLIEALKARNGSKKVADLRKDYRDIDQQATDIKANKADVQQLRERLLATRGMIIGAANRTRQDGLKDKQENKLDERDSALVENAGSIAALESMDQWNREETTQALDDYVNALIGRARRQTAVSASVVRPKDPRNPDKDNGKIDAQAAAALRLNQIVAKGDATFMQLFLEKDMFETDVTKAVAQAEGDYKKSIDSHIAFMKLGTRSAQERLSINFVSGTLDPRLRTKATLRPLNDEERKEIAKTIDDQQAPAAQLDAEWKNVSKIFPNYLNELHVVCEDSKGNANKATAYIKEIVENGAKNVASGLGINTTGVNITMSVINELQNPSALTAKFLGNGLLIASGHILEKELYKYLDMDEQSTHEMVYDFLKDYNMAGNLKPGDMDQVLHRLGEGMKETQMEMQLFDVKMKGVNKEMQSGIGALDTFKGLMERKDVQELTATVTPDPDAKPVDQAGAETLVKEFEQAPNKEAKQKVLAKIAGASLSTIKHIQTVLIPRIEANVADLMKKLREAVLDQAKQFRIFTALKNPKDIAAGISAAWISTVLLPFAVTWKLSKKAKQLADDAWQKSGIPDAIDKGTKYTKDMCNEAAKAGADTVEKTKEAFCSFLKDKLDPSQLHSFFTKGMDMPQDQTAILLRKFGGLDGMTTLNLLTGTPDEKLQAGAALLREGLVTPEELTKALTIDTKDPKTRIILKQMNVSPEVVDAIAPVVQQKVDNIKKDINEAKEVGKTVIENPGGLLKEIGKDIGREFENRPKWLGGKGE